MQSNFGQNIVMPKEFHNDDIFLSIIEELDILLPGLTFRKLNLPEQGKKQKVTI